MVPPEEVVVMTVVVREFDGIKDSLAVEQVERKCEVGPSGGELSLFTDLLGDPICRVRNSPAYLMLVRMFIIIFLFFYLFLSRAKILNFLYIKIF